MNKILKAMKISGIIGLMCLIVNIIFQWNIYMSYRSLLNDTFAAMYDVDQITSYAYQYQLTVYKDTYNKKDYVDYNSSYENCLEGMNRMLEYLKDNKAMKQIDPQGTLQKKLSDSIDTLTSEKPSTLSLKVDDKLSASVMSQASMITSYLESNRLSKQRDVTILEVASLVLNLILILVCTITIFVGQKYAKVKEEEYEEQVNKENYTDGLTGLLNQKYVTQVLPGKVESYGSGYLYMFDMDNFKKLNDTCGHAAGDRALQGFAEVMMKTVRERDIPCRLGGDEFILYAYGIDNNKDAIKLAKRIQNNTKEKFAGTELDIVAISCGMAQINKDMSFDKAKKRADKALYYVKENCKGGYHVFKPAQPKQET